MFALGKGIERSHVGIVLLSDVYVCIINLEKRLDVGLVYIHMTSSFSTVDTSASRLVSSSLCCRVVGSGVSIPVTDRCRSTNPGLGPGTTVTQLQGTGCLCNKVEYGTIDLSLHGVVES